MPFKNYTPEEAKELLRKDAQYLGESLWTIFRDVGKEISEDDKQNLVKKQEHLVKLSSKVGNLIQERYPDANFASLVFLSAYAMDCFASAMVTHLYDKAVNS